MSSAFSRSCPAVPTLGNSCDKEAKLFREQGDKEEALLSEQSDKEKLVEMWAQRATSGPLFTT